MEKKYGHDPSVVTIDEVAGMWVSLVFLPKSIIVALTAFLAFRIFDIIKPYPARLFDEMHGGIGIMMDDVVAGSVHELPCSISDHSFHSPALAVTSMNAEIITIGDELLIGQVINSNQAYIAERLNTAGVFAARMTTVGDDEEEILSAFAGSMEKIRRHCCYRRTRSDPRRYNACLCLQILRYRSCPRSAGA